MPSDASADAVESLLMLGESPVVAGGSSNEHNQVRVGLGWKKSTKKQLIKVKASASDFL